MNDARLAHLLNIQGQLLDRFLEQNLGGRYFYCIVVSPAEHCAQLSAISNASSRETIVPMLRELTRTLTGKEPLEVFDAVIRRGIILDGSHGKN